MKNQMDALQQTPKLYQVPAIKSVEANEDSTEEKRSWLFRRLVDIGVIEDMATPQPKGWNVNPSNITVLIGILLFFGTICGWLWNVAYKQGADDSDKKYILERLKEAEEKAARAERLQIVNDKESERMAKEKQEKEKKK